MEIKEKIVKTAQVCYIVAKVFYFLAFAICLAFIVLAIVFPINNTIKEFAPAEVAVIFSCAALYVFICIGLLWNVQQLFKNIAQEKSPFSETVSHYLKKIAIFILILAVVPAVLASTVVKIVYPATEFNFPIEAGGILAGVVMFLIGMFFKYGNELQKKDDETL